MRVRRVLLAAAVACGAAVVPSAPARAGSTSASAVDTSTRASMYAAYQQVLKPALAVPVGWTGSVSGCDAGAPSAAGQQATLTAVNWFREAAGVAPVTFDPALSAKAQQAALMMHANDDLDHSPPTDWACYTAEGAEAAGRSNLAIGSPGLAAGARAITLYMDDAGLPSAGHRRWVIDPRQKAMGSGSTSRANALYVMGDLSQTTPNPDFVPWPPSGYLPVQLEPGGYWSLSSPGASFSGATVTVHRGGTSLPVTKFTPQSGYGSNALVWYVDPAYGTGLPDRRYDVTVSGIVRNGVTVSHSYSVTLFDGEIDADQTISFGALANRTYGAAPATLSATASSGLPVTFSSGTPSVCATSGTRGTTLTLKSAGTCTVHADQAGDAIRNPAPRVTRSFEVAKRPLTVTANDAARAVGAENPAFAVTYSGFAPGETLATSGVTGSPSCATTATADSPPGEYPITCGAGTLQSGSYSFAFASGTLTVGAGYQPVQPARLLDTRPGRPTADGLASGGGPVGPGGVLDLVVTGRGGVPASGVGAVVLNVTAVAPTQGTYVTAWPKGTTRPTASNVSAARGVTTAGLAVVGVGTGGKVSLYNALGSTNLIADVVGWFPAGGDYAPLVPARVLDTRAGRPTVDGAASGGGALGPGAARDLAVTGRGGVPFSGAGSVVLSVTAVAPTRATYVSAWPAGAARPTASNLNPPQGVTTANLVVVPVGAGGAVSLYNAYGSTDLVADVVGWFPAGADPSVVPARLLDTRAGRPTVDGVASGGGALGPGAVRSLVVTGRGGVPASGVGAVVLNVTAVAPTQATYVTAWPAGTPRPTASNLNPLRGVTTANLVVVRVGAGGEISLYNALGSTHLIADVVGWFPA